MLAQSAVHKPPIPVERIASRWAHIVREALGDEISGMLVPLNEAAGKRRWAILVNAAHAPVRQRFTIAHELGHLLLHGYQTAHADKNFKIRLRDTQSSQGSVFEEIEANRFAAELLMPEAVLTRMLRDHALEYADEASDGELERLAALFEVSKQAFSIRLSSLLG